MPIQLSRRMVLAATLAVALPAAAAPKKARKPATAPAAPEPPHVEPPPTVDPETAMQRLMDGNTRYVAGRCAHPNQDLGRRTVVAAGQQPFAVILACADSRVAPELIFDQG